MLISPFHAYYQSRELSGDTVVKYTLSEKNTKIFASKYKLYLPTEEELRAELQREYIALDTGRPVE